MGHESGYNFQIVNVNKGPYDNDIPDKKEIDWKKLHTPKFKIL